MSLDIVRKAKADLEHSGEDLSGPCGALKITNLVAWRLRATGAGLLYKPAGNNCLERATDIICYPDGTIRDILGDGGGANTPMWPDFAGLEVVGADRYREPFPVLDDPAPVPTPEQPPEPIPAPPTPPVDLSPILEEIFRLRADLAFLKASGEALRIRIEALELKPFPELEVSGSTNRVWSHAHNVNLTVKPKS